MIRSTRFSEYGDIDLFVTIDTLWGYGYHPEHYYFGEFRVCDLPQTKYNKVVQVVFLNNMTLNEMYLSQAANPRRLPYPTDHIPLFYTFDFPECSNYIEITIRKPMKIFVEECECLYLDMAKILGHSYPIRSRIVNNRNPIRMPSFSLMSSVVSGRRLEKYIRRAGLTKPDLQCMLNFLKPICPACVHREKLARSGVVHWYEKILRPNHPYTIQQIEEGYNFFSACRPTLL